MLILVKSFHVDESLIVGGEDGCDDINAYWCTQPYTIILRWVVVGLENGN